MIKLTWLSALALAMVVAVSATLHAQTLQEGTWTGELLTPSGNGFDVTYAVTQGPDGPAITFSGPGQPSSPVTDVSLEGDTLAFSLTIPQAGFQVACMLTAQDDGGYAGECTRDGRSGGQISMVPPKG